MSIDPIEFLKELVAIKSLSGQETAVSHYLASTMNATRLHSPRGRSWQRRWRARMPR